MRAVVISSGGELATQLGEHLTQVSSVSFEQALVPHVLTGALSIADEIILIATDDFLGLGDQFINLLDVAQAVIDTVLSLDKRLLMLGSTLALGRSATSSDIKASAAWTDDITWNSRSFLLHLADRIYWRGIAEGMRGNSLLIPIITDDNRLLPESEIHIRQLLSKGLYPQGSMGFVSMSRVIETCQEMIHNEQVVDARKLICDKHLSYQKWITTEAGRLNLPAPTKALPRPASGWRKHVQSLTGQLKGLDMEYVKLLSTEFTYSED